MTIAMTFLLIYFILVYGPTNVEYCEVPREDDDQRLVLVLLQRLVRAVLIGDEVA